MADKKGRKSNDDEEKENKEDILKNSSASKMKNEINGDGAKSDSNSGDGGKNSGKNNGSGKRFCIIIFLVSFFIMNQA